MAAELLGELAGLLLLGLNWVASDVMKPVFLVDSFGALAVDDAVAGAVAGAAVGAAAAAVFFTML